MEVDYEMVREVAKKMAMNHEDSEAEKYKRMGRGEC